LNARLIFEYQKNIDWDSLAEIERDVIAAVDDAVAFAEASPAPQPEDALKHVYW